MAKWVALGEPAYQGERAVRDALMRLSDEWTVYHSVEFLDRNSDRDRERELDFLVACPDRGLAFVEVKGGQVVFDGGQPRQRLPSGWERIDPVGQVSWARRTCFEYLHGHGFPFIRGFNVVVFPHVSRPSTPIGQKLEVCGLFSDDLEGLPAHIEDQQARQGASPFDGALFDELIRSCLRAAPPDGTDDAVPAHGGRPVAPLRRIVEDRSSSFRNFESVREDLLGSRSALETLWDDVVGAQTDFDDDALYANEHDVVRQRLRETERLMSGASVQMGVFGQVKRGKSSLFNALLGYDVSSVGLLPKTAVPVIVEYSAEPGAEVEEQALEAQRPHLQRQLETEQRALARQHAQLQDVWARRPVEPGATPQRSGRLGRGSARTVSRERSSARGGSSTEGSGNVSLRVKTAAIVCAVIVLAIGIGASFFY